MTTSSAVCTAWPSQRQHGGHHRPAAFYVVADRHRQLYREAVFPMRPDVMPADEVARRQPAWAEAFTLKQGGQAQALLQALQAGTQEEIRLRARMMAPVDEGVGQILELLERRDELADTCIVFLGDNGYFFGEHGLGPERRFAYEEGIRSPFVVRYPRRVKAGTRVPQLVICQDIRPRCCSWPAPSPVRTCRAARCCRCSPPAAAVRG